MSDYEYRAARRQRKIKNYFRRIAFYGALTAILALVNIFTYSGTLWFHWAILGFGIDLLVKYFVIFGVPGIGPTDEDWEAEELEKEIRRLEAGRQKQDELELRELERPRPKAWDEDELV